MNRFGQLKEGKDEEMWYGLSNLIYAVLIFPQRKGRNVYLAYDCKVFCSISADSKMECHGESVW